ncbi:GIY-YIG nuclease family protein [Ulvibacterium marinum]|uniref:GIY-YIG nuclease family protein n=1 Tax=Ulvibacterium marinum TaxID=2419782 RepID=UPI001FE96700|nr:GIY-YIG nuclease family protein [Ulvibacterium marinum]
MYILHSTEFNKFYVGLSQNIDKRLKEHNEGWSKSTRAYIPWRVVHSKKFKTRMEARTREKYLKTAAGRRWRKDNIDLGD